MATSTQIEWTDATWNPVTGCTKVSPGCKNCYAARMASRLQAMRQANYVNGFQLTLQPKMLELPCQWKTPKRIFVNSMSDLFHPDVPLAYIKQVFDVMHNAPWHQYQILTKRSQRLVELSKSLQWEPQIWMGVSVESAKYVHRVDELRRTDAHVRFLSLEPLLGPLENLNLNEIDWVIVGGESGPYSRTIETTWVKDIRDQCVQAAVPFFFKQWGGVRKKSTGRMLDGRTWDALPTSNLVMPSGCR